MIRVFIRVASERTGEGGAIRSGTGEQEGGASSHPPSASRGSARP